MDKRLVTRWAVLASAVVAVLALAACGDDDEGPIPQTGVRQTTTSAPTSTTAAPAATTTTAAASTTTASTSTTASSTTTTAPSG